MLKNWATADHRFACVKLFCTLFERLSSSSANLLLGFGIPALLEHHTWVELGSSILCDITDQARTGKYQSEHIRLANCCLNVLLDFDGLLEQRYPFFWRYVALLLVTNDGYLKELSYPAHVPRLNMMQHETMRGNTWPSICVGLSDSPTTLQLVETIEYRFLITVDAILVVQQLNS